MKTTRDYSYQSGDEKILSALQDIDNWYNGLKIPIELNRELAIQDVLFDSVVYGSSFKRFSFTMGFSGVQGYPVVAFWNDVKDALHTMTQ
jgi:hypothetical protein